MTPQNAKCDDYKGGIGIEGGEYSLGQSTWKYENGNFIVYGGESGKIYYMLFSSSPWGAFEAYDYAPNPSNKTGSFEIKINQKTTNYKFREDEILLAFVSKNNELCHDYIELASKDWRIYMKQYANSIRDDEYWVLRDYFVSKTKNCK